jgi:hypothetical protein
LKAVEEHADKEFIFRMEMWRRLQHWREYAERHPEYRPPRTVDLSRARNDREKVEMFFDLLRSAAFYGDKKYGDEQFIKILLETAALADPPEPDMTPGRAMIKAYSHRFGSDGENRPTAMEVDRMAKVFLHNAGQKATDRHLKRIRKKVGAKTRRLKKKRKMKPGEEYDREICFLWGEEAKAATAAASAAAASSKTFRDFCHVNRSWLAD